MRTQEPDPKDYEFGEVDPKYIRALARWEVRQELAGSFQKPANEAAKLPTGARCGGVRGKERGV
jgi:hypothetical protein